MSALAQGPLSDYIDLAYAVARREARSPSDVDDLAQEGLLFLWESLPKAGEVEHPRAWAATIFRRRMRAYYRRESARRPAAPEEGGMEEVPGWALRVDAWQDVAFDDREYLTGYLQAVEERLGEQAAWLAMNLLSPGPAVGQAALEAMREKEEARARLPAGSVRGYGTPRVSKALLAEVGGFSSRARMFAVLRDLRDFTSEYLAVA